MRTEYWLNGVIQDSQYGVARYSSLEGNYEVKFFPPLGYRAVPQSNCTGYIMPNDFLICNIQWRDDVVIPEPYIEPIVYTPPTPIIETVAEIPQPTYTPPTPEKTHSGLTYTQINAIIILLEAFGVDERTIHIIYQQLK